jgi:hypothetical protein
MAASAAKTYKTQPDPRQLQAMIDTVSLALPQPMHHPSKMKALGFSPSCGHSERDCRHLPRWKFNSASVGATLPRITWSESPDRLHWLSASVSLPKMLFGSNVDLLANDSDIETGLIAISRFVSEAADSDFDALSANVTRVDFCQNWRLTPTDVYHYLRTLSQASLSRMTRYLINDETVQFSNKSQTVIFYDKLQEVMARLRKSRATDAEARAAVGVLRFENRLLNNGACQRLAGKLQIPDTRAEMLLTSNVAQTQMNDTLSCLGLDKPLKAGDGRLDLLRECYGLGSRFRALAGFLCLCDEYGADNLVSLGIYSRADYYRKRRQALTAGAWLVSNSNRALPALV